MISFANFLRTRRALVVAAAVAATFGVSASGAFAQGVIIGSHDDIQVTGDGSGGLILNIHNDDTDESADPANTFYGFTDEDHLTTRTAESQTDSQFDILGVSANQPYYLNTQTGRGGLVIGLDPGVLAEDFAGTYNDLVTFNLVGFSGPGTFTMFRPAGGNINTVYNATSAGGVNAMFAAVTGNAEAGHIDYAFAFSQAGIYNITLQAVGSLDTDSNPTTNDGATVTSAPTTYRFAIGNAAINSVAAVVPEAGTLPMVLGAMSVFGIGMIRRHRK